MGILQNLSIRRQQMLIVLMTSSAALLLACAAFVIYDIFTFRDGLEKKLSSLATLVGNATEAAVEFNYPDEAEKFLANLRHEKHIVRAYLYRYEHGVPSKGTEEPFALYRRDYADERPPPRAENRPPRFGDTYFTQSARIANSVGRIDIESDLGELYDRLGKYFSIVTLVLAASLLVAFVLSARLQRVISDPILHLAAVARAISVDKNYSVRLPAAVRRDELGQLTDGFNEMLAQIQAREAALKGAQSDLELRVSERTQELQQEIVDRKRAEVALQQQLTRISLLNSITRAIAARQDLESIVHVVLKQLEDHLPQDCGAVFLHDVEARTVRAVACQGKDSRLDQNALLFSEPHTLPEAGLEACLQGQVIAVPDTAQKPALVWSKLAAAGLGSAVAVPLNVESELFGVLLSARAGLNAFSEEEIEFLRMLSQQVALAAHQARLHTQLQRAYNELRQTQQTVMQQERLRALGQMASGIAHDINNALSPVIVYAELLLQTEPNLSGSSIKNLEIIRTAGQDIAHIVARMREFYRKREETDAFNLVNLNKLAGQVIDLTRPRWRSIAQASGLVIDLQVDLDRKLPDVVGNESELREALTNLVLNAVDAMPAGGKLTVRTLLRKWPSGRGADDGQAFAVIEVCDTGVGMDEATRQRCLEPFFSTKGQRGTGLGLAMVYGIMERHEGTIEIDSHPGRGSTFRLVLPVKKTARAKGPLSNDLMQGLRQLRILCIDDEPLIREAMRQILEFGHHKVELADGGQSGLDCFRAGCEKNDPFDVVITDLGMPYLDGRQLAAKLKAESPATPVIMLTGWGNLMKEDGELPAEVDGILSKPPRMSEVYELLRKVSQPPRLEPCAPLPAAGS